MKRLNPDKLSVRFGEYINPAYPVKDRKYTLTHSDFTGDLFLTIALDYDYKKITPVRDDVLGAWTKINGSYNLFIYVIVDNNTDYSNAYIRNQIFIKELPLALEAIYYGDKTLFNANPELGSASIYVHFISRHINLNRIEYWGALIDYS